jgi:acyl transferase domain-containing protein/acyl carrier protein
LPVLHKKEPVAVIGMGCRFPGANNLQAFWEMLSKGEDAITDFPSRPERFAADAFYDPQPETPGKIVTQQGGFLSEIDCFDYSFFGIAPREAAFLDPQIRVLLEIAWEALEDAGEVAATIAGSSTGVFIGATSNDYLDMHLRDLSRLTFYALADNLRNMLSGRLSFTFDLRGPSLTIDTAFSSSLVAVHLACQSLWSGESSMALAGGVHLSLQPGSSVSFSQARMLSPTSRCKAFAAEADGFVPAEGAGIVLLKLLAQAIAEQNPIHAVICGSAVSNDGKSGPFLFTPSQKGQEITLRRAYQNAGKSPAQVDYIETHGAGTQVGDPIEVAALSEVLGPERTQEEHCYLGSVKTNIGHTESAAGIAGLLKTILCLKHRTLVPNLHFQTPNPAIPWQHLPLKVVQQVMPWPQTSRPALAGVSAFGLSGTNAHIVLEEAPLECTFPSLQKETASQVYLLILSAKSEPALVALAQVWQKWLVQVAEDTLELTDLCLTAALRRNHHEHRLAIVGTTQADFANQLEAFCNRAYGQTLHIGRCWSGATRKIAFVFPGQGAQWISMGKQLFEQESVFREALEQCEQAMHFYTDWSLLEQLVVEKQPGFPDEISYVQPLIFAIQVALAKLWISWGLYPDLVIGHSMGEIAAAHIAGILSLEDATRIICLRSQLLQSVSGQGAMVMVGISLEQAHQIILGKEDYLSLAVSNSPDSTVLSGDPEALREVMAVLEKQDIFCRPVNVDVASHSSFMDPLLPKLSAGLCGIKPRTATVPLYSTVTASILDGSTCDAAYWVRNLREPVLFAPVIQQLVLDESIIFLEVSPHPLLASAIQQCTQQKPEHVLTLPSMRRHEDERTVLLSAAGALYTAGVPLNWRKIFPHGKCVSLPNYPWQRERCWSPSLEKSAELWESMNKECIHRDDEPERMHACTAVPMHHHDKIRANDLILAGDPNRKQPVLSEKAEQLVPPIRQRLLEGSDDERPLLIEGYITDCIATILGSSRANIDPQVPLVSLGLDSLMFLEVRKNIARDLGIQLPLVLFLQKRSVQYVAQHLCEIISFA